MPNLAQHATWLCGPAAWMDEIAALWHSLPATAALQREQFAAPPLRTSAPGAPVQISFSASRQQFHTKGGEVLLKQAENAGLSPKHGCRIGICRSCQCVKESGVVENVQTGEISSAPNELIRLCISVARSDTTITL
ncbi:MAG: 2Fe-2S iron-sulfur cluster binding domain-containing protein [Burkholderiales bacterium]|nr:2Fe-2S iron-sulfur cluster binding domain-containing protein [Burkholderiales bacterium]